MRRWLKRIALGLVVFLAVAIAAIVTTIHTNWGRGLIKDQVETQLAATFVGGGTIGRLEGSPFTKLIARDIVINAPDGTPAITLGSVTIDLDLLPLIRRRAIINQLAVDQVTVSGTRDANGELQLGKLMRPGPPSKWNIELRDLSVRRATVMIAGTADVEQIDVDELAVDATAMIPAGEGETTTAAAVVRGMWRQRGSRFGVDLALSNSDAGLVVPGATIRADGITVIATDVHVTPASEGRTIPQFSGVAIVSAPRTDIAHFAPEVRLTDDVVAMIDARSRLPWTALGIRGAYGATSLVAAIEADLQARQAHGSIATGLVDLTRVTAERVVGSGTATIVFDAGLAGDTPVVQALVGLTGEVADLPAGGGMIAVEVVGERARVQVAAAGAHASSVFGAAVHRAGDVITLERFGITAMTSDPARATAGKAPVHGRLSLDLVASGQLAPTQDLAVRGRVDGYNVRFQDLRVSQIHGSIDARGLPARPLGTAKLRMADLVRGDVQIGAIGIAAVNREDGRLAVSVRSQPKFAPWLIDADALVTLGETVLVELGKHRVRGAGEDWSGVGGRVTISPDTIELRDLRSTSTKGSIEVAGSFDRKRGDIVAHLAADSAMSAFNPVYRGDIDATIDVTRTRGEWGGTIAVSASGLALDPRTLTLDAKAQIALRGRELGADVAVSSLRIGTAKLQLAVETPRDITDVAAWSRLGRSAIREARVSLDHVDLGVAAELAKVEGVSGQAHGDLRFSATQTGGTLEVKALQLPVIRGTKGMTATMTVVADGPNGAAPTLVAEIPEIGKLEVAARVAVPEKVFDPRAWQALGADVLRGATVCVPDIAVDPGMLQRFGIVTTMRGHVAMNASIGPGARTVKLAADVRQLRGGPIAQPIDVHVVTSIDGRVANTRVEATSNGVTLLTASGDLAVTLADLVADPRALSRAAMSFEVRIPKIEAARVLATFGRREVTAGTLDGKVTIGGTLARPTIEGSVVAENLDVPPGPGNTPVQHVDRLAIEGTWSGTAGTIAIDGKQRGGGTFKLVGRADLNNLADGTVTLDAKQFDLIPILAFLPGPAGGASGRLDANLVATGLDPRSTKLIGTLHLANARIPLAPNLGTLRRAEIDVRISDRMLEVKVDGRLGPGTIKVAGSAALEANSPTGGEATITLRSVAPIGAIEPRIDADITAKVKRENGRWNADVVVNRGKVVVPDDRGDPLDPIGAPPDMVFATELEKSTAKPTADVPPSDPVIVAKITIKPVYVESNELRGDIEGVVTISAGNGQLGIVGDIEAVRGDVDLFGRRYAVERGAVHFDGSTDPILDVRIIHDFVDVTTVTEVRGRLSDPELVMSSDPGIYSQGQLLGFLLGGEPGGDPSAGNPRDAATSAGASAIANKLGSYVSRALPIDLDVLRYESATATSSASVTVGTWITRSLFLAYRRRLESRPDENSGEGQAEYWLNRKVVVEGVFGDRGFNGVDLLWRHRY